MLFFNCVIMGWLVWVAGSVRFVFGAGSVMVGGLLRVAGGLVCGTGDDTGSRKSWEDLFWLANGPGRATNRASVTMDRAGTCGGWVVLFRGGMGVAARASELGGATEWEVPCKRIR